MKTISNNNPKNNNAHTNNFEVLNIHEMLNIRGGNTTDKLKSKEIDIYDTRED
jgi:hypothetical protein